MTFQLLEDYGKNPNGLLQSKPTSTFKSSLMRTEDDVGFFY